MNLHYTDEQKQLRDTVDEMLATESSPARVRASESVAGGAAGPAGFDASLWKALAEMGVVDMRVPEPLGGAGAGLLDAALVAESCGRHLACVPAAESMAAYGLLGRLAGESVPATECLAQMLESTPVLAIALDDATDGSPQWVPGGAAADAIVVLEGDELTLAQNPSGDSPAPNLGCTPLAAWPLSGDRSERVVLTKGDAARNAHAAAVEEWKLLTAAALGGLGRRALEIAAAYASERIQFDRPIATFQGVAHPLADAITAVEGGRLLVAYAVWAIARRRPDAAALVSMAFAWNASAASDAAARSLHVHGGYGLSLEYDIQLYHRRAKAWALAAGDPSEELQRVFARRFEAEQPPLPDAGAVSLDFSLGAKAESFGREVRALLDRLSTPSLRSRERLGWEAHDPDFQKALAKAGLLFPNWPESMGGRGCDPFEARAHAEELDRFGWPRQAFATTRMVGETLMRFGSEALKRELLPRIAGGEAICCLGYTEPASGSDVAAASTRAVRDGDDWVIDGQKMFTSGANVAQYVFLLTRTDPDAPKHRGLTLFLVPLDTPGIEVHPIHTLSDERSNATYYSDVRISDLYRVGEVNGGWDAMGYALHLEHGGGGGSGHRHEHEQLVEAALAWARGTRRDGGLAVEDARVRERIGRAATRVEVTRVLGRASLFYGGEDGGSDRGFGPMVSLFGAESYIEDASNLLDMAAPVSLFSSGPDAVAGGEIEYAHRLSTATSIYGGTSEIMRSIVAQVVLGMPRSRS